MIGLAIGSHQLLQTLEERRCIKLGHRSSADPRLPASRRRRCSLCVESHQPPAKSTALSAASTPALSVRRRLSNPFKLSTKPKAKAERKSRSSLLPSGSPPFPSRFFKIKGGLAGISSPPLHLKFKKESKAQLLRPPEAPPPPSPPPTPANVQKPAVEVNRTEAEMHAANDEGGAEVQRFAFDGETAARSGVAYRYSPSATSSRSASESDSPGGTTTTAGAPLETIVVPRAHRLLQSRESARRVFRDGKIDWSTAENGLCEDLINAKLKNVEVWDGAVDSLHRYGPNGGFDWVKQKVVRYVDRFVAAEGDPPLLVENLTIVPGARAAYDMLGFCLFEAGDAVLSTTPTFAGLVDNWEERAQVKVVPVPISDIRDPHLDCRSFQRALQEAERHGVSVKAISLVNPHVPLGHVFPESEVLEVCKWAVSKNLFIIADEVFASTISTSDRIDEHEAGGEQPAVAPFRSLLSLRHKLGVRQRKKVVWIWSVSTDLCIPGARFGVLHTENRDLQKALRRLETLQPCPPVVQHLVAALLDDLDWLREFHAEKNRRLAANRRFVEQKLDEWGVRFFPSTAAFFLFVDLSEYLEADSWEAEQRLWKRFTRAGVFLTAGRAVGHSGSGWFRMNVARPREELEEGLKRLHAILLVLDKRPLDQPAEATAEDEADDSVFASLPPEAPVQRSPSEEELMRLVFAGEKKAEDIRVDASSPELPREHHEDTPLSTYRLLDSVFTRGHVTAQSETAEQLVELEEKRVEAIEEMIERAEEEAEIEPSKVEDHHLLGHFDGIHGEHTPHEDERKEDEHSSKEDKPKIQAEVHEFKRTEKAEPTAFLSEDDYAAIFSSSSRADRTEDFDVEADAAGRVARRLERTTTIQTAGLPQQQSTVSNWYEADLPLFSRSDSARPSSKITIQQQRRAVSETTTFMPRRPEVQQLRKLADLPLLPADVFERIFGRTAHEKPREHDERAEEQQTASTSSIPTSFEADRTISLASSTETLKPAEEIHRMAELPEEPLVPHVHEAAERYASAQHDSGVEDAEFEASANDHRRRSVDSEATEVAAPTTRKEDDGAEMTEEMYERIFVSPTPPHTADDQRRAIGSPRSDQDVRITTDLRAFARRSYGDEERRERMEATLSDHDLERVFSPEPLRQEEQQTQEADKHEAIKQEHEPAEKEVEVVEEHETSPQKDESERAKVDDHEQVAAQREDDRLIRTDELEPADLKQEVPSAPLIEMSEGLQRNAAIQPPAPAEENPKEAEEEATTLAARAEEHSSSDDYSTAEEDVPPTEQPAESRRSSTKSADSGASLLTRVFARRDEPTEDKTPPSKRDFRRSEKDEQITTDLRVFAQRSHEEAERRERLGEPTLPDDLVQRILRGEVVDERKKERPPSPPVEAETRELRSLEPAAMLVDDLAEEDKRTEESEQQGGVAERNEKAVPVLAEDEKIDTDLRKFVELRNEDDVREVGEATLSAQTIDQILTTAVDHETVDEQEEAEVDEKPPKEEDVHVQAEASSQRKDDEPTDARLERQADIVQLVFDHRPETPAREDEQRREFRRSEKDDQLTTDTRVFSRRQQEDRRQQTSAESTLSDEQLAEVFHPKQKADKQPEEKRKSSTGPAELADSISAPMHAKIVEMTESIEHEAERKKNREEAEKSEQITADARVFVTKKLEADEEAEEERRRSGQPTLDEATVENILEKAVEHQDERLDVHMELPERKEAEDQPVDEGYGTSKRAAGARPEEAEDEEATAAPAVHEFAAQLADDAVRKAEIEAKDEIEAAEDRSDDEAKDERPVRPYDHRGLIELSRRGELPKVQREERSSEEKPEEERNDDLLARVFEATMRESRAADERHTNRRFRSPVNEKDAQITDGLTFPRRSEGDAEQRNRLTSPTLTDDQYERIFEREAATSSEPKEAITEDDRPSSPPTDDLQKTPELPADESANFKKTKRVRYADTPTEEQQEEERAADKQPAASAEVIEKVAALVVHGLMEDVAAQEEVEKHVLHEAEGENVVKRTQSEPMITARKPSTASTRSEELTLENLERYGLVEDVRPPYDKAEASPSWRPEDEREEEDEDDRLRTSRPAVERRPTVEVADEAEVERAGGERADYWRKDAEVDRNREPLPDDVFNQVFEPPASRAEREKIDEPRDARRPLLLRDPNDEVYRLKPLLTDFSFIEEIVQETMLRRQHHQYRPDIDQYRLSMVEEVSEASGSPVSRRSLRSMRGSTKSHELVEGATEVPEEREEEEKEEAEQPGGQSTSEANDQPPVPLHPTAELQKTPLDVEPTPPAEIADRQSEESASTSGGVEEFIDLVFGSLHGSDSSSSSHESFRLEEKKTERPTEHEAEVETRELRKNDEIEPLPLETRPAAVFEHHEHHDKPVAVEGAERQEYEGAADRSSSTTEHPHMQPLHVEIQPHRTPRLPPFNQTDSERRDRMEDSGIGSDIGGLGSITIDFALQYDPNALPRTATSEQSVEQRNEHAAESPLFTADELRALLEKPPAFASSTPKVRPDEQAGVSPAARSPRFVSFIDEEEERKSRRSAISWLRHEESPQATPPIYSEADIWKILGDAHGDKKSQQLQQQQPAVAGKRQSSAEMTDGDEWTASETQSPTGAGQRVTATRRSSSSSVDLDVRIRSSGARAKQPDDSPTSTRISVRDNDGETEKRVAAARASRQRRYERRHPTASTRVTRLEVEEPSAATVIHLYNRKLSEKHGEDQQGRPAEGEVAEEAGSSKIRRLRPDIRVSSGGHKHRRAQRTKSHDVLRNPAGVTYVHHDLLMEKRPKSLPPHAERHFVVQHTNITEFVIERTPPRRKRVDEGGEPKEGGEVEQKEAEEEEEGVFLKSKSRMRVDSHGATADALLNRLVFEDSAGRSSGNEEALGYVEVRRRRAKSGDHVDEFTIRKHRQPPEESDSSGSPTSPASSSSPSAHESPAAEFVRTASGRRWERAVQTQRTKRRRAPVDFCCRLRLLSDDERQKRAVGGSEDERKADGETKRSAFLVCKNPQHSEAAAHCDPRRLFVVKRSSQQRGPDQTGNTDTRLVLDHDDYLTVSTSSDSSNSIDRISVRHSPGASWMVSSVCRTTRFGFDRTALRSRRPLHAGGPTAAELPTVRSRLYSSDADGQQPPAAHHSE
ncbi:1-aminocyclopropane-1-carboxylate synthase-like protein 1 [Aphelenchoides fujianensis]|nr:1-aminocyclopropane-1-carboxylate synthase-like protein 1 [Aphelenchoides fujianensis]